MLSEIAFYILTGSLALPIGLHLGTNFADSALFGGTAPRFEGFPAAVRMSTEIPGGWEAAGGLVIPAQVLTLGLVLLWIYGFFRSERGLGGT